MGKMSDRIKGLRYQKWRLKQMMLDVDPKIKKKKGAEYFELDDDIEEEWIKEHQEFLVEELKTKAQKKFDKENEKLKEEGKKEMKPKEVEERMEAAKELAAKFKKENKTKKVIAEGKGPTVEKFEKDIAKLDERVENMKLQAEDKENNKEVALGTSKIVSFSSTLFNISSHAGVLANVVLELYRSPPYRRLLEEVQRSDREVLF
jgi:DNA topoisomerase-1